ncbi:diguanylate cyclase [Sulfurimonas sp.]|uniref:diguanylate cyclase n=1 Tax=Sulfurimonas sp. TaxID=2022749 RepID=UPI0026386B26|nr:diguanylate cyclase [Sulfurimonas sp.]
MRYILLLVVFTLSLFANHETLEKVSLQLLWKHQFEFAGFYMAKEKGYYQDVGLDVTLKEYENGLDIMKSVVDGNSTFGISYTNVLLYSHEIVLLSAIYQTSPLALVSLNSSNIQSLEDLKNKKVMIEKEGTLNVALNSMLQSAGFSFEDMKVTEPTFDLGDLLEHKVDISSCYITNELYALDKMGVGYKVWHPKKYGYDFYDNLLFTSKEELQKHPKQVENFTRASLKGWEYALSHINETVDVILKKYNSQHKREGALLYEAMASKPLILAKDKSIGNIEKQKIDKIFEAYRFLGLLHEQVDVDDLIYKLPKNEALTTKEKAYLQKKKVITMCVDPHWMPFEKIDKAKHIGMSAEYFKIFEDFIGTKIELIPTKNWSESIKFAKKRKCDILSLVMPTSSRKKYINVTAPYLKIPIVMATKTDKPFIVDFASLGNEKLAITKGYAYMEILKEKYPYLNIVEVENLDEGLQKVLLGEVYGYIGTLATIRYAFKHKYNDDELKITGKFDGTWDLGVGVRNDDATLLHIFDKAVKSVSHLQQEEILNHWVASENKKDVDYTLIYWIVAVFLLIISIGTLMYLQLLRLKNRLQKQTKELMQSHELLKEKQKELELLASTDPLTKLYNRRYFTQISEKILNLAKRNKEALSVMMLDIDDFKKINDTFGHKVGDDVLVSLAKTLKEESRKSDIICRFGGEEFILLLPNTDIKGAYVIAQKIRKKIHELRVNHDVKFTVSIGVSEVDLAKEETIEQSIKRADDALYEAKRSGKDRVCLS